MPPVMPPVMPKDPFAPGTCPAGQGGDMPERHFAEMQRPRTALGWLASASVVALLMSGVAVWAMQLQDSGESMADTPDQVIAIVMPPAATVGAVSEAAPETAPDAPEAETPPQEDLAPEAPQVTEAMPERLEPDAPPPEPQTEELPVSDEAPPPPEPETVVSDTQPMPTRPQPRPEKKPEPKPEQTFTREAVQEEPQPEPPAEKPSGRKEAVKDKEVREASDSAAPKSQSGGATDSVGAGKSSAKAEKYPAEVLRKIHRTKKRKSPGKGVAVVSFSVTPSGGLASIRVIRSSGLPDLDQLAVEHISRAAPFAPPPPGALTSFSVEYEGK